MIKWAARLALLTILLGLTGSILILTDMFTHKSEKKISMAAKDTTVNRAAADTQKIELSKQIENIDTTPPPPPIIPEKKEETLKEAAVITDALKKADTAKVLKKEPGKKVEKVEVQVKVKQPAGVKKAHDEKLFSQAELQHIVSRINAFKVKNKMSANCVQMHITEQGYSKRTLSQIETYLKSNHFSIAGREVISKNVRGIHIMRAGTCVRIVIGTF
jgi:hypothetical protein